LSGLGIIVSDYHNSSAYPPEELFRFDYMGICGLDGRSRAPRDGFMASHIIDTEQLRIAKLSFDGNQVIVCPNMPRPDQVQMSCCGQ